jgi:flagellar biosynthesis GTPase FlhF
VSAGRRRRRRGRKGASLAGDPLDLFLDAITNALGVIMFILLMVVLFGRATDSPAETEKSQAEVRELERLREELRDLEVKLAALPPAGDPELAARWKAASERLPQAEQEVDRLKADTRKAEQDSLAAAAALAEDRKSIERLTAEAEKVQQSAKAPTGFVRVSRFQQDNRKSVILTLAGGKLSRFRATADTKEISAPKTGSDVPDAAAAAEAVAKLLDGYLPTTHRVELLVWEGSFRQAKLVEQAILDRGFDSNPLPVRAGTSIQSGTGGVQ